MTTLQEQKKVILPFLQVCTCVKGGVAWVSADLIGCMNSQRLHSRVHAAESF